MGCFQRAGWCGGRDLNPRRPTPEDLKSAKPEAGVIDYLGVKDDFMVWLRSRGLQWDHYVSDFLQYMDKFCKPIKEPMDLVALFVD